jgi:hypothetical protein
VGYRAADGSLEEQRFDWIVNPPLPVGEGSEVEADVEDLELATAMGIDLEQDLIQRTRKALFAPQVVAAVRKAAEKRARKAASTASKEVRTRRPEGDPGGQGSGPERIMQEQSEAILHRLRDEVRARRGCPLDRRVRWPSRRMR